MGTLPWAAKEKKRSHSLWLRLLTEPSRFIVCSSKGARVMLVQGNTFSFHSMSVFIDNILGFNINIFQSEALPYQIMAKS